MAKVSAQRRWLVLGALGIAVLVVTSLVLGRAVVDRCGGWSGCDANGLPLGSVTVRDLESHTEATLTYQGATVVDHGGVAEQDRLAGGRGLPHTRGVPA